jgi:hypothetical protein
MEKGSMRHLMWILTWIAVGIGGALGAASVLMLTASRHPTTQSPDTIAGGSGNDKVLVTKPRPGSPGRSVILGAASRHEALD